MKKNSFLAGAMIATIAIILVKIIGILYIIPFYSIVGVKGTILYGYAYSIYAIFLSLSTSGIPIAISKIISEYNALGYYNIKEKAYKIGSFIIVSLGIISFMLLMIFAPSIAKMILGNLQGGNTIEEVSFVIRIVATALLSVPILSVTKGYLQGHKFIYPASIAIVIEQLVRVLVILIGSYLVVRVFNLSITTGVGVAVFGAAIGAFIAYFYLIFKIKKNKDQLNKDSPLTRNEARIKTKDILKKLVFYAFPFILIDVMKSAYAMIDVLTVVSTMVNLGFSQIAELTIGVISNWGVKLNMIVISISLGVTVSLIPHIASSYVKKDFKDISLKVNQTLQAILFFSLPMTIGLYFLAQPTWIIFYSFDEVSIDIFKLFVFQALSLSFFSILINLYQTMNDIKIAFGTLFTSFLFKMFLNIPAMHLFSKLGLPVYYAPIILTLVIHLISIIFLIYKLANKYQVDYKPYTPNYIKIVLCSFIMFIVLKIVNLFIEFKSLTKMGSLGEVLIFTLIGGTIYLVLVFRSKLVYDIFGERFINKILYKLKLKKNVDNNR